MKYSDYKAQHTTRGCKITHIIGIPLILASIYVVIFLRNPLGIDIFLMGWLLQLLGHSLEGNSPSLSESPMALIYGIVFLLDPQTYIGLFKNED
jgi:uncharacterized membrane protein YGL010W